ncbi:MAG TPA: hypothetical protein VKH63_10340 [Candidatus Acidoferrum sp.]|jgi:hypothetical protein|nr:hypothetical protein [Candidatus Acidoferrum sp.]
MAEEMEYRVIGDTQYEQMERKLNKSAAERYRPILVAAVAVPTGVQTTVILEHALARPTAISR